MAKIVLARGGARSDVTAACDEALRVGDLVFVAGEDAPGTPRLARADPRQRARMPAVGVVSQKPTDTTCTAALFGAVDLPISLAPGATYFVGDDGRPTTSRPRGTPAAPAFVQRIGEAIGHATLFLPGSTDMIKVVS